LALHGATNVDPWGGQRSCFVPESDDVARRQPGADGTRSPVSGKICGDVFGFDFRRVAGMGYRPAGGGAAGTRLLYDMGEFVDEEAGTAGGGWRVLPRREDDMGASCVRVGTYRIGGGGGIRVGVDAHSRE
jgi:hypothetical protein